MKKTRVLAKLRMLLVAFLVLAAQGYPAKMEVMANERTIETVIYGKDEAYEKRISGDMLFGNALFPGSSEITAVRLGNETDTELYYKWDSRPKGYDQSLYKALRLRLRSSRGAVLYDGPLEDLMHIGGPVKNGDAVSCYTELYLPADADNKVTDSHADFDIVISFAAGLFSDDGKMPPETEAVRESQAALKKTAERTRRSGSGSGNASSKPGVYAVYDPSGPAAWSRLAHLGRDDSGNPLIISIYDRDGINAPRSGFAFGAAGTGGGERKTYDVPDPAIIKGIDDGIWVLTDKEKQHWKYCFEDGTFLAGGFAFVRNRNNDENAAFRWFYFNEDGVMMSGWIRTDGDTWYHARELPDGDFGALETGWITGSEDGALYYTNEQTAVMMSGWVGFRNGAGSWDYSYFARLQDTYRQNWFFNTVFGRWVYDRLGHRCYGSMYVDEMTPDRSRVDAKGRKIG